jgi:hypothetical protein
VPIRRFEATSSIHLIASGGFTAAGELVSIPHHSLLISPRVNGALVAVDALDRIYSPDECDAFLLSMLLPRGGPDYQPPAELATLYPVEPLIKEFVDQQNKLWNDRHAPEEADDAAGWVAGGSGGVPMFSDKLGSLSYEPGRWPIQVHRTLPRFFRAKLGICPADKALHHDTFCGFPLGFLRSSVNMSVGFSEDRCRKVALAKWNGDYEKYLADVEAEARDWVPRLTRVARQRDEKVETVIKALMDDADCRPLLNRRVETGDLKALDEVLILMRSQKKTVLQDAMDGRHFHYIYVFPLSDVCRPARWFGLTSNDPNRLASSSLYALAKRPCAQHTISLS